MLTVNNVLIFLTVWSPILAYVIWNIELKDKTWYLFTSTILFSSTIWLAFNPIRMTAVTPWLHYYSFFMMVYLLIIGVRYDFTNFNKVLSMGVFMLFIAGDWWELPIFIYDYLGKIGLMQNHWTGTFLGPMWIFSHIRRLYTLATAYLFAILTKMVPSYQMGVTLLAGTGLTFLFLLPLGLGMGYIFEMATTTSRLVCLALFGYATLFGMRDM